MAKIINVEKSQYLNSNIEMYASNKVGQYSKYLDKNPLFVTYFHINSAQSRTDVGTGGVNADLGKNSPIRFNQINNLPVYNIPELKPDAEFDENGYDIELELSDLVLLPNTIKPIPGDYLLIVLPSTIEFLFRVNQFSYNTIQSNDFYLFSADLKSVGHNLITKIESQVVQKYETIFENIGTDDKCFILEEDVPKIQSVGSLFQELQESYISNFFDPETGTFVCKNNDVTPMNDYWFYDKYVERFIMDSGIFYIDNEERSIVLSCADLEPPDMNRLYMQTLHYSVLNNKIDYLSSHPYYYQVDIQKPLSPFVLYQLKCKGVNLVLTQKELVYDHSDGLDSGLLMDYFHHELIHVIKGETFENGKNDITQEEPVNPSEPEVDDGVVTDDTVSEINDETDGDEIVDDNASSEIPDNIENETPNEDVVEKDEEEVTDTEYTTEFYLDEIIYRYLTNQSFNIDKSKLIPYMLRVDCYTYMTMPLVIYIIMKYYNSYFEKTEL